MTFLGEDKTRKPEREKKEKNTLLHTVGFRMKENARRGEERGESAYKRKENESQ